MVFTVNFAEDEDIKDEIIQTILENKEGSSKNNKEQSSDLTPIKSALLESNRNTSKFIKKIQEIVDNKNKENIETDREI
ncbi:hypothetical protein TNCT_369301 [Trichonephila clavata]|uniref:Uncharacterized protein n=1 Tax=Trichonephila clavata TaxID=2740835 RepID=A0A8X6GEL9_TRICU|nr:hypothetical protein TNCT_369301 [Trichonephila clavata]